MTRKDKDERDWLAPALDALAEWRFDALEAGSGEGRRDAAPAHRAHPAITHCDNCGCDWLDNGLNPVSCPYCTIRALLEERDALKAENDRLRAAINRCQGGSLTACCISF